MRRYPARACLDDVPCGKVLRALYRQSRGRAGVTVGINQLARAAKVKPEETRRLMGFLSRMRFLTFSRGRAALTPGGLASVASGMRLPD